MAFRIFISHSVQDMELVNSLKNMLTMRGLDTYVSVSEPEPGRKLIEKVKENIKSSSHFLLLLTKESVQSTWVQNEIGIALSLEKTIIPIVEKGVEVPSILQGIEYLRFDSLDPSECISTITEYLVGRKATQREVKIILGIILVLFAVLVFVSLKSQ